MAVVPAPEELLSPEGPVARLLGPDFESRGEQARMAEAVALAMERKSHLLVEAGTGVGKSFAYLVPAILRCVERGETVVVATNTISLQEQLMSKDIPVLRKAMVPEEEPGGAGGVELTVAGGPRRKLRASLVKGRGNYLSVRRLRLASQRQDRLFSDPAQRRSLHAIEDWAYATTDGTLSTMPTLERQGVWGHVQSDSGNCMGRKCGNYDKCFYQKARREMEQANLLVCNHALFFADLALRSQDAGFLPRYDHVILDEAHNIEDVAAEHFGVSLGEGRVHHLLSTLYSPRQGKGYLPQLALRAGEIDTISRATALVEQASAAANAFFESLAELLRPRESGRPWTALGAGRDAQPEGSSLRLREPGAVANVLTPVMRELSLRLKLLKEQTRTDADTYELNAYAIRAEMIATEAELLVSQSAPGYAYWVEASGDPDAGGSRGARGRRITFACSPVEVAPLLKERLFSREHSVVLTSATLATRTVSGEEPTESGETAFAHTLARLGCEGAQTLQLGSPFDYAAQVEFFADLRGGDAGRAGRTSRGSGRGLSPAAGAILDHIRATGGGAFVLFTSYSSLNALAAELAGPLAAEGFPLLAQGRDGSRTHILARFRENDRSVLFGAASFWQGVDVRGRGLRNVILTKLPFEPPDRPLTQARNELIESRGGNPFMEDSLPRAVIRFKQGFGRLIRSRADRGRVVCLDPRVVTARYGRYFMAALPPGVRVTRLDPAAQDADA